MKAKVRWTDKETGMIRGGTLTADPPGSTGGHILIMIPESPYPDGFLTGKSPDLEGVQLQIVSSHNPKELEMLIQAAAEAGFELLGRQSMLPF
jgi:hypothetical protein